MDKLEQMQNKIYDEITSTICDNDIFRKSCSIYRCEDKSELEKLKKQRQLLIEFSNVTEDDICNAFYNEFTALFEETRAKNKRDFKAFYINANIIDFKKLCSYVSDNHVYESKDMLTDEELKEYVKELVKNEISTEKLECMICYGETHKIYSNELFWELYEYLNVTIDVSKNDKTLHALSAKKMNEIMRDSEAYLKEAKKLIDKKSQEWYSDFYGVIENCKCSIVNWNYDLNKFKEEVLAQTNECYYQIPQNQIYVLNKLALKMFDKHIKAVYNKISKDHFRVLSRNNRFNKIRNKTGMTLLIFGLESSFNIEYDDITIPKLIYDEYEKSINQICDHKIIKTTIKSIAEYTNNDESLIILSDLYIVYIKLYLILSDTKKSFMRKMINSCKKEGMINFLNSAAFNKLPSDEYNDFTKILKKMLD